MTPPRTQRIFTGVIAVLILISLWLALPRSVAAEPREEWVALAVIVGQDTKVAKLGVAELRRGFTGDRYDDPGGSRLIPINHPPRSPDRVGFDRVVLGMDPDQVGRFWIDQRIRGGARPPRTVDDAVTLRRLVERLPGAIGYLRPAQVSGAVKLVRVDGKLPGESGYPIVYRR